MSGLEAAVLMLDVVTTLFNLASALFSVYESIKREFLRCVHDYGPVRAFLLFTFFQNAKKIINRVKRHVIDKEPREAGLMKKSYTESFTMIAVAV